nr:hypothetical protein [Candidatus Frankia alpina]
MEAGRRDAEVELEAERDYLLRGRRALAGMRAEAECTQGAGGDPFADKVTNEYLRVARLRRIVALAEGDGTAPLFFARLDYAPPADTPTGLDAVPAPAAAGVEGRRFYLGRRHVREAAGDDPLVVDWRADIARPFYRAHRGDPMGVLRRRRFGHDGAELTAFEDELLTRPAGDATPDGDAVVPSGGLLEREIERPRSGPMRDIVATIQPEQDEIVRAELSVSLCVQRAPGSGKTAVGLHRAAYLLFAHRERLARAGVLVVGPDRAFLGYIAAVLPALGAFTVRHSTLADLVDDITVGGADTVEAATLKGDARMATVLRRALHDGLRPPDRAGGRRDQGRPVDRRGGGVRRPVR